MRFVTFFIHLPQQIFLLLIRAYQKTISPDHSAYGKRRYPHGYCRFYPTCSQYAYDAIKKHGLIRGFVMSVWRVLRCNPWSDGGIDTP